MRARRRFTVAVVGDGHIDPHGPVATAAFEVGRGLVDRGFRVLTGGLRGVMEAALRGAHHAAAYREGDTVAVLPGHDPGDANEWADIVLPTGLGIARNLVVASSDAVVAVGGGSGTLSEIAFAWQLGRPIVALRGQGWAARLAGRPVDDRWAAETPVDRDPPVVHSAASPAEAVVLVGELLHGGDPPS